MEFCLEDGVDISDKLSISFFLFHPRFALAKGGGDWYNRKGIIWDRDGGSGLRIDPSVKRTTRYIALCVLVLSAMMEAVYLIIGEWNLTVLWGNLLGGGIAALNFFLMALTVQRGLGMSQEDAKKLLRVSQSLRLLMMLALCAIGASLPVFDPLAVLLPLFFPRIGTFLWSRFDRSEKADHA